MECHHYDNVGSHDDDDDDDDDHGNDLKYSDHVEVIKAPVLELLTEVLCIIVFVGW